MSSARACDKKELSGVEAVWGSEMLRRIMTSLLLIINYSLK